MKGEREREREGGSEGSLRCRERQMREETFSTKKTTC